MKYGCMSVPRQRTDRGAGRKPDSYRFIPESSFISTDYSEDIEAFVKDSHSGEVLIVPTELAYSDTRLKEFLESREPLTAGEYSIYGL